MVVAPIDDGKFQVKKGSRSRTVNLIHRICTCRKFDLDQISCAHALAAIRHGGFDVHEFCADYFKTENLRQLYSGCIYPVGHPDDWSVPVRDKSRKVLPPIARVWPGTPQSERFPSAGEKRRDRGHEQVCLRCKEPGHNQATYNNIVEAPSPSLNQETGEYSNRPHKARGVRHCSTCGEPGHNRKNCPTHPTDVFNTKIFSQLLGCRNWLL